MLGRNSLSCTQACSCPSGRVENPRAQNQPACHLSTDPCQPSWPRDSYLFSMPVHAPALPYSTAFTESASPLPRLPYPNDLSVPTLITGGGGLQPQQHRHTKITATFRDSSGLLVVALRGSAGVAAQDRPFQPLYSASHPSLLAPPRTIAAIVVLA